MLFDSIEGIFRGSPQPLKWMSVSMSKTSRSPSSNFRFENEAQDRKIKRAPSTDIN